MKLSTFIGFIGVTVVASTLLFANSAQAAVNDFEITNYDMTLNLVVI